MFLPTFYRQLQQHIAMLVWMIPLILPCVLGLTHRLEIQDKDAFRHVKIGSEISILCVAKVTQDVEIKRSQEYEASVAFIKNKLGTSYSDYVVSINTTKGMEWTSTLTVSNVTAEHKGYYACRGQFPIDNTTHGLMHDIVYLGVEEEDHLDWDQVIDQYNTDILVKQGNSTQLRPPSVELTVVVAADTLCVQMDSCNASRNYSFKEPLWTSNLQYKNKILSLNMDKLSGFHLEMSAFDRATNKSTTVPIAVEGTTDVSGPTPVLITAPDQVEVNQVFSAVCTRPGDDEESRTLSMSFTQDHVWKICPDDQISQDHHETQEHTFTAQSRNPFSIFARLKSPLSGRIKCAPSEIYTDSASKDICVQNNISFDVEGPSIVMEGDEFELKCTGPSCTGAMGKTPINWVRQNLAGLHEHGNGQCAYRNMATLKMNQADNTSSRVYDCTMGQGNNMIIKSINVTVVPAKRTQTPANLMPHTDILSVLQNIITFIDEQRKFNILIAEKLNILEKHSKQAE